MLKDWLCITRGASWTHLKCHMGYSASGHPQSHSYTWEALHKCPCKACIVTELAGSMWPPPYLQMQVCKVKQGPCHALFGICSPSHPFSFLAFRDLESQRKVKHQMSSHRCLNAYCAGGRSCRSKITSQMYRVNRKKEGHNGHNQLTNSKQELFRLNGPNPTGFSLFF